MASDPRLLVPLDMVPETWPAGLPLWHGASSSTLGFSEPATGRDRGLSGVFADLTATPADEHGSPLRLDALGWALGVLGRRGGDAPMVAAAVRAFESGGSWSPLKMALRLHGLYDVLAAADDEYRPTAGRAIVAAALRAGVGL